MRARLDYGLPLLLFLALCGCARLSTYWTEPAHEGMQDTPNPLPVPMANRDWLMDQISDELDDHFRIAREQRMQLVDSVLTEGWIETHPRTGSTLLEPWHRDSQPGFEKLYATLQTVRRFAKVRVIPSNDQYWIDLKVFKELEDLPQPVGSTVGGRISRHDNSIEGDDPFGNLPANVGWIPLGRDLALEQAILRQLQERIQQGCQSNADPGF
jgi:hypothetical protein